jgi:succinyl-diaminopimelate desuccinylase
VIATVTGSGLGPHLALNGHLDTLSPGEESAWSVPIYEMSREAGRLSGLGIGNMKAGVAALALATAWLHERRSSWPGRVTLTAVADETVFGPDGAAWLLDARPELVGDALICAEGPGSMGLAIAEKGLCWIEVEANAPPGQGMTSHRRSGSIARLAEVVSAIDALNEDYASPPHDVAVLADWAGEHGLKVSANCGTISGGRFISQVATSARAEIDIRVPPGLSIAALEARIEQIVSAGPDISWRRIKGWDPNWTSPEAPICQAARRAVEAVRGAPAPLVVRLPASDAARWRARGVPALCFGPQPTLAAGVDDYVLEQDVIDCAKIYAAAAIDYLSRAGT